MTNVHESHTGSRSSARALASLLLGSLGVTHVVTVPDNSSAPILAALDGAEEVGSTPGTPKARVLWATREGEAVSMASGLWLGGARPAVLIQNTGLLESGDALRGTASRMGVPLLLLITCRGYAKARSRGLDPGEAARDRDMLVRSDLDSVALMTEPTLRAWGVPFHVLRNAGDLSPMERAWAQAQGEEGPVAVLLDASFS